MSKQKLPEWNEFRVGTVSTKPGWDNPDCQPLTAVYHVTHVNNAWQIINDGKIRADLVRDESKLNTKRILVAWVSPNNWTNAGGFRYGNVRCKFEWAQLVEGKNYYWVESIAYGIPACRILVTEKDYTGKLQDYDPTIGDGPWWYDQAKDRHYWNGNFCLEIMLEQDLYLGDCSRVDFVQHHRKRCNSDPRKCPYLGFSSQKAECLFIAGIIAQEIDPKALNFTEEDAGDIRPSDGLFYAISQIEQDIEELGIQYKGHINHKDEAATHIMQSVLDAYSRLNSDKLCSLARLFSSEKDFAKSYYKIVHQSFNITDWKPKSLKRITFEDIFN